MATVRDLRDTLEYCMLNEKALDTAIKDKRDYNRKHGGGRKSSISKPTEAEALCNLTSVGPVLVNDYWLVEEPERTLNAIRYTKAHFCNLEKYGKIYRAKFLRSVPEKWHDTCYRLNIPKTTYYDHINKILDYAVDVWGKLRCLD